MLSVHEIWHIVLILLNAGDWDGEGVGALHITKLGALFKAELL